MRRWSKKISAVTSATSVRAIQAMGDPNRTAASLRSSARSRVMRPPRRGTARARRRCPAPRRSVRRPPAGRAWSTATRSVSSRASARSWVQRISVQSPRRCSSTASTSCCWSGSRPLVGSSTITSGGSCRKAWARETRCWKPFERWPTRRSATLARSKRVDGGLDRGATVGAGEIARARGEAQEAPHPQLGVEAARSRGRSRGACARPRRRSVGERPSTSRLPLDGSSKPVTSRMKVVLPAPLAPEQAEGRPRLDLEVEIVEGRCGFRIGA